jgi:hypothetical protein
MSQKCGLLTTQQRKKIEIYLLRSLGSCKITLSDYKHYVEILQVLALQCESA